MNILIAILVFLFGLAVGSFFNAFVWRFGRSRSILERHSVCVHCKHPLAARDLIPLVSYAVLRGACRYCGKPIPRQYALVEFATGFLLLLVLAAYGVSWACVAIALFSLSLLLLFLLDLRYSVLPDEITLPAFLLGAMVAVALGHEFSGALLSAILGAGFFSLQYVVSRGAWIGSGDIRLGAVMGVALGWKLLAVALFFSYCAGAAVGIALILTRKKTWKSHIPFGTFLAASTFLLLIGAKAVEQYLVKFF
jgi:leader peptidase (prepilin peptidase)/N-methyltransferase